MQSQAEGYFWANGELDSIYLPFIYNRRWIERR